MHLGSFSSQQDALAQMTAAVDASFGSREDRFRPLILEAAAQALWLVSQQSLNPYEAEPDFIAGARDEAPA